MRVSYSLILLLTVSMVFFSSCKEQEQVVKHDDFIEDSNEVKRNLRFTGNYNKDFNDLQDLHMSSALSNGISPLKDRGDTVNFKKKDLVRLPSELELYKTYHLTHSIPYLVLRLQNSLLILQIIFVILFIVKISHYTGCI